MLAQGESRRTYLKRRCSVKPCPIVLFLILFTFIFLIFNPDILPRHQLLVRVTQTNLTREGIGAAVIHLRMSIALAESLHACLHIPRVKSTHGYYVADFFPSCPRQISPRKTCKVAARLAANHSLLLSIPDGGPTLQLDDLRHCHTIEIVNPSLRDYENRLNSTAFIFSNMKQRSHTAIPCDRIDTVYHYRYGDIRNSEVQKYSKQVPESMVLPLVRSGQLNESRILIVTDKDGQSHLADVFPLATFFTANDPAALRDCAGRVDTLIAGGSSYAYLCFQLLRPRKVLTAHLDAPSRCSYPPNIATELHDLVE